MPNFNYIPSPSKCVVPVGLEPAALHPGNPADLKSLVFVDGLVVGFACLTPELLVRWLKVGTRTVQFSTGGFPSEAAGGAGIVIPAQSIRNSMQVTARLENRTGHVIFPTAFFLVEIDRPTTSEGSPDE